jgi:hypothetical protein
MLERDYWVTIDRCRLSPAGLAGALAARFPALAPAALVSFRPVANRPLSIGDEVDVFIRGLPPCRVRVLHRDGQSFTLGTLGGHPEAGRITFGAYRNPRGDVVLHVRSRARASSPLRYLGFIVGGEPMQTSTWTDFLAAAALTFGSGALGPVHAETHRAPPLRERAHRFAPTFLARGN